jgi:hypothetical protein
LFARYSGTGKGDLYWSGLFAKQIGGMAYGNGYLYFVNCNWGNPEFNGNNLLVRVQRYAPVP